MLDLKKQEQELLHDLLRQERPEQCAVYLDGNTPTAERNMVVANLVYQGWLKLDANDLDTMDCPDTRAYVLVSRR